jgi:hypothetical protein
MVPATAVASISTEDVRLTLSADDVRALEPFQEQASYHLGLVGLFGSHLGWVREGHEPE